MSDLMAQGLYQQLHARPVAGEDLEVLGKTAASKWASGQCPTLNEAVVSTVKHAGLSPEQVRRVVEFTNTDAFLGEFKKEGSSKVVDFGGGGPADPSEILKDLNDGGGGTVFDRGQLDYSSAPTTKIASDSRFDADLAGMFGASTDLPYTNPLVEVIELREKLASAYENFTAELSSCERMYEDLQDGLFTIVKQAALGGHSLGDIAQVMALGAPADEYMKVAFDVLTPRLIQNGVYSTLEQAIESMDKTASSRNPNLQHPLVVSMREFSDCLTKMAELRANRAEVNEAYGQLTTFIKEARSDGGAAHKALGTATSVADSVGHHAGRAASAAKQWALGGSGAATKKVVHGAIKHAPAAATALGVVEIGRRARNNQTLNSAYHKTQAHVNPMSDDWKIETMRQRGELQ